MKLKYILLFIFIIGIITLSTSMYISHDYTYSHILQMISIGSFVIIFIVLIIGYIKLKLRKNHSAYETLDFIGVIIDY